MAFYAEQTDQATTAVRPAPPPQETRYDLGDVSGPVLAGDGTQNAAGRDQYLAGRDKYDHRRSVHVQAGSGMAAGRDLHANDYSVEVNADYDPSDELFEGKGLGRFLMWLGTLIALGGFAVWMYLIFTSTADTDPFTREIVPGVPMAIAGFGCFAAGGVLAGLGGSLSKAARKRERERERQRRRRNMRRR